MNRLFRSLNPRQIVLLGATGTVVLSALLLQRAILPVYDQWRAAKLLFYRQSLEYTKLRHNLGIRESVQKQFASLPQSVYQVESDAITLSEFLKKMEALDRFPSLTLTNAKALPVKDEATHKIFPVKLSVAGKLREIVMFVTEMLTGDMVVGMDGLSLRGVQGGFTVECTLSVRMVRLLPEGANHKRSVAARGAT